MRKKRQNEEKRGGGGERERVKRGCNNIIIGVVQSTEINRVKLINNGKSLMFF